MKIIDTHAHLNDDLLYPDRKEIVQRAKNQGITTIFNNADSLPSFERILSLQKEFPSYCYAVLGIHPEFANETDEYKQNALDFIKQHHNEIKAIGEIGLDYHYDKSEETKAKQQELFIAQIELAKELRLPIVIHSRDADFDTLNIIKTTLPPKIDLHCYSGSYEILKEYLKLPISVFFGIGGVSTFKNAKTLHNIIKEAPISVFLTETDCPYLSPVPFRGQINEPSYLPYVIKQIAMLKEENEKEIAQILYENGKIFYEI